MNYDIDAIYDNGAFRPLESLMIPDGTRVHLRSVDENGAIETSSSAALNEAARKQAEMNEFRRIMAELLIESPNDGFSGADHDQLLYGEP